MVGRRVDIFFKTDDLRALCSQEKVAKKRLGTKGAKKLRTRLADLMAADNMAAIIFGRPHPLRGDLAGCTALDLDSGCRLVVEPAHNPAPIKEDGSIDWATVDAVRVVLIGDYHD